MHFYTGLCLSGYVYIWFHVQWLQVKPHTFGRSCTESLQKWHRADYEKCSFAFVCLSISAFLFFQSPWQLSLFQWVIFTPHSCSTIHLPED